MRNQGDEGTVGLFGGNAEDQTGADFGCQAEIDEPDLSSAR